MTRQLVRCLALLAIQAYFLPAAQAGTKSDSNWPQFRGAEAKGVADGVKLPTHWSIPKNEGVSWKTPIPGLGHSSPIVWDDRIYVTTAVSKDKDADVKVGIYGDGDSAKDMGEQQWMLICINKRNGKLLWQKEELRAVPSVARHTKATHCNSTPATNGNYIVTFLGAEGLFCFDMDGALVWKKDLGRLEGGPLEFDNMEWGFASSPVIHDGLVIVQCDVHDQAFIAAFDIRDGREVWRTERDEIPTWGTPTIYSAAHETRIAVNGYKHIGGYDFKTGKEVWKLTGGGDVPVPTPVCDNELIYITSAHGAMAPLYALSTDIVGDVAVTKKPAQSPEWSTPRNGAYMQTPVVYQGLLYSCSDRGVLKCYDARTGQMFYQERLGKGLSGFTASPVAGDGKVFFVSEEGEAYVVRAGREFKVESVNQLGEVCLASPAISGGRLFFRTRSHVIAIGE